MSRFNPYAVEEVLFENSAVSVFAGQGRYSGGVSGLGGVGPERGTVYDFDEDKNEWVAVGTSATSEDVYTGAGFMGKVEKVVTDAGLPAWAAPAIGLGVLGVGGFFLWKAIKRR